MNTAAADPAPEPLLRIGAAGWTIPSAVAGSFAQEGTSLARYAGRFCAVEINSSFHRRHRRSTYERWAAATPERFRFAVKAPKVISHKLRLVGAAADLDAFLADVAALGRKLGPLLFQLPPSLAFDAEVAASFLELLRARHAGPCAWEPRHPSWFSPEADRLLRASRVARVAADPPRAPHADEPGGWSGLRYFRLHGAPRMYYSAYDAADLARLAARLGEIDQETWCIFDNTASGAGCRNALELSSLLAPP